MELIMDERIKRRLAGPALQVVLAVYGLNTSAGASRAADLAAPLLAPSAPSVPASDLPKPPPPPLGVFGDSMPDPGHLTLSLIPTFYTNAHQLVGTKGVTPQQIITNYGWYWDPFVPMAVVPQEQFGKMQTLTAAYGVMKDVSVVLTAGTIERLSYLNIFNGSSNLIERGTSNPGTDTLADASASVVWRAYEDPIHRIKFNLGMSFPLGSNHNLGGAVTAPNGTYNIGYAFYGMQPGTGTFDVLPGVLYAGTIAPWSWGLSYRARLALGPNPQGYYWGNYQELNSWVGYTLIPGLTATFRSNFNIQSQIAGANPWLIGKLPSANPLNYGGKAISVFAGAELDGKLIGFPGVSLGVEGGVPVYQNLNGPQLARVWQAGMALRWKVGEEEEHAPSKTGIFKGPTSESAPPRSPWTGGHMGVNAGFTTSGDANTNFLVAGTGGGYISALAGGGIPSDVPLTSKGFIGGFQFGYDRVFYDRYLLGIEGDLQGVSSGTANWAQWAGSPATYVQNSRSLPYLGTARGRVGYLATPDVLVYGSYGLAYGETDLHATYFSPKLKPVLYQGGSWLGYNDMRLGWTAGGGVEWMFLPNWSAKAEYLYYNLGLVNTANIGALYYTSTAVKPAVWSSMTHTAVFDGHVMRLGVNYHFEPGAPEAGLSKLGIFAADLPNRKSPPPSPVLWTGLYAGLNAGAALGGDDTVTHTAFQTAPGYDPGSILAGTYPVRFNDVGFMGGGQVGYNRQIGLGAGKKDLVAGLEADFQGLSVSNSQSVSNLGQSYLHAGHFLSTNGSFSRSVDYLGTVRGRAGLLMQPSLLTYATFGLAYGGATFKGQSSGGEITSAGALTGVGFGASSYSDSKVGYSVGGGLEWMVLPNWSLKAEYLYYNLGKFSSRSPRLDANLATGAVSSTTAVIDTGHIDGHVIRTGVNYHFDWAMPSQVVAKY
jgi:opacity protein-like surface antigen